MYMYHDKATFVVLIVLQIQLRVVIWEHTLVSDRESIQDGYTLLQLTNTAALERMTNRVEMICRRLTRKNILDVRMVK